MSGSVLVLRVFGRVVAMFSFGVLLLLAACGGGGSGGVVRVQLDGVSPSSGGPGTLVELAGRFGLGTSFEVCGIPLGDLVFVDASGATVLPADMSLGVPYSLARGAVPEIPAGKACEVSVLLDGVVVAGAGGATVTFESLAVVPGVPTDLVASPGDGGLRLRLRSLVMVAVRSRITSSASMVGLGGSRWIRRLRVVRLWWLG